MPIKQPEGDAEFWRQCAIANACAAAEAIAGGDIERARIEFERAVTWRERATALKRAERRKAMEDVT